MPNLKAEGKLSSGLLKYIMLLAKGFSSFTAIKGKGSKKHTCDSMFCDVNW